MSRVAVHLALPKFAIISLQFKDIKLFDKALFFWGGGDNASQFCIFGLGTICNFPIYVM